MTIYTEGVRKVLAPTGFTGTREELQNIAHALGYWLCAWNGDIQAKYYRGVTPCWTPIGLHITDFEVKE